MEGLAHVRVTSSPYFPYQRSVPLRCHTIQEFFTSRTYICNSNFLVDIRAKKGTEISCISFGKHCAQILWPENVVRYCTSTYYLWPNIEHILWSDTVTKYCGPPYIVLLWPNVYIMSWSEFITICIITYNSLLVLAICFDQILWPNIGAIYCRQKYA